METLQSPSPSPSPSPPSLATASVSPVSLLMMTKISGGEVLGPNRINYRHRLVREHFLRILISMLNNYQSDRTPLPLNMHMISQLGGFEERPSPSDEAINPGDSWKNLVYYIDGRDSCWQMKELTEDMLLLAIQLVHDAGQELVDFTVELDEDELRLYDLRQLAAVYVEAWTNGLGEFLVKIILVNIIRTSFKASSKGWGDDVHQRATRLRMIATHFAGKTQIVFYNADGLHRLSACLLALLGKVPTASDLDDNDGVKLSQFLTDCSWLWDDKANLTCYFCPHSPEGLNEMRETRQTSSFTDKDGRHGWNWICILLDIIIGRAKITKIIMETLQSPSPSPSPSPPSLATASHFLRILISMLNNYQSDRTPLPLNMNMISQLGGFEERPSPSDEAINPGDSWKNLVYYIDGRDSCWQMKELTEDMLLLAIQLVHDAGQELVDFTVELDEDELRLYDLRQLAAVYVEAWTNGLGEFLVKIILVNIIRTSFKASSKGWGDDVHQRATRLRMIATHFAGKTQIVFYNADGLHRLSACLLALLGKVPTASDLDDNDGVKLSQFLTDCSWLWDDKANLTCYFCPHSPEGLNEMRETSIQQQSREGLSHDFFNFNDMGAAFTDIDP
ncbi:hypothetical protein QTG54_014839 [Skeletonema marinoi]|uniref:Uncharacterized protein n=1 Tax=Skeletonema marinoi TaxID=267567 RepID=A0AAD9D597_9STRA|nr:hypothetical protein QTG54_014839 [Skeletonema marinoi]